MDGGVGSGMISGGWEYVFAAYGASWGVLLVFALFALARATPARLESPE